MNLNIFRDFFFGFIFEYSFEKYVFLGGKKGYVIEVDIYEI